MIEQKSIGSDAAIALAETKWWKGDMVVCPWCDHREAVESIFMGNRLPREDDEIEAESFTTF